MRPLSTTLSQLQPLSRSLDGSNARRRLALLRRAAQSKLELERPAPLLRYHELLLFLAAFAGSAEEKRLVEAQLKALARCLWQRSSGGIRFRNAIAGSGSAGSVVEVTPALELLRWMLDRWPDDLEVVWRDDSPGTGFGEIVDLLSAPCEFDGLVDPRLSMRQWLARSRGNVSEAAWIAGRFHRLFETGRLPSRLRDVLFDRMELDVRWQLRDDGSSRTSCRFPQRPLFAHARDTPVAPAFEAVLNAPLPRAIRPRLREAARLIDIARCALASRGRETDPVTYANPREVLLFQLERGIDVLVLGLQPSRRLPLEAYLGYIAARNRVPLAYGGGWCFLDQCTIGINIFDTFRGGESLQTLAQVMRVYRQMSGARVMSVDPYQFGHDNEEAIGSGAFWFYWRAGFRPVEPDLLALAQREAAHILADPAHRSPPRALRRLATGRMRRRVGDPDTTVDPFIDPGDVALSLTRWIAEHQRSDPERARRRGIERMVTLLRLDRGEAMQSPLAELVVMIDDLEDWPRADRVELRSLIRARTAPRELDYVRRLRGHRRLRAALARIAGQIRTVNVATQR